jgi:acetyltransferase
VRHAIEIAKREAPVTIRNLEKIFKPKRVAVVGASDQPGKVGYTLLQNLIGRGYEGVVYPVNSKREAVQGIVAYKSLSDLPNPPDLAVICTPAATVPDLIDECGRLGILGVVIISAGFREVGPAGQALEDQIRAAATRHRGLRIIGPNCLGVMVPSIKLNASFAADMALPGRVAFLSQSGALCTSVLDWARAAGIGFSHFLSIGNMLDVGLDDLLDYLALDPETDSVVLYVESITRARQFMSAARAFSRDKPIVAYKAGRFADSAQAAASHTGAMAGVDAVYEAAFRRAGIVRVQDMDEIFDCAELLARGRVPKGPRLAIITNAGGPGVMACDALLDRRGVLAKLDPTTLEQLNRTLPSCWSHGNPVDVLGDAPAQRYADALAAVLADPGADAALVVLTPQAMSDPTASSAAVIEAARRSHKPVLTAWMGGAHVHEGDKRLHAAGIPAYTTPEHAVRAFMRLVEFARNRETLNETPREVPVAFALDAVALREQFQAIANRNGELISEDDSKQLLASYGIPVCMPRPASTAGEAAKVAEQIGYPVVLKVLSPQITHKTDVGGVVLNLATAQEVLAAFDRIVTSASRLRPDAQVQGVTVQRMVTAVHGVELILGMKRDPVFGPVVMVGFGGIAAEVFQDKALELPPLNERLARRMLESLRSWPLLTGYRGRPVVNVEQLIEALMRFSYLVAHLPEIAEVDINPLLVTPQEVVALDARIVLDRQSLAQPIRPHSHLAILPYPEEWIAQTQLADGSPVRLRPIRPEDEPLWRALVASCSPETLRQRFRCLFQSPTHEMATRFCVIDYDREIAIVAERAVDGERQIAGVGRLIADPDHNDAEFAVLVADAWQGRGVGSLLMDHCLKICARWGIRSVSAETAPDNTRMLAMFRERGFTLDHTYASDAVLATKELG